MSKIAIIYQSKYGSTKKYAQWLSEELAADVYETKKTRIEDIEKYDTIIFGGGIYATGVAGISFLRKNYVRIKDKKLAVFAVGASPYSEKGMKELRERNFKGELSTIPCFYFRGSWDDDKMSWIDLMLCNMLKKAVAKKDPATYEPWEVALMETIGSKKDWSSKDQIKPIVEWVKNNYKNN